MSKLARIAVALAAALAMPAALACGICLDDKVASAYDHAVVQRALAHGRVVVFCELRGPREARLLTGEAQQAAKSLRGVDPASVRAAKDMPVVSFELDTSKQTPQEAIDALRQIINPTGAIPTLLKVLQPGKPRKHRPVTSRLI